MLVRRILAAWGIGTAQTIPIDLARLNPAPMDALAADLGRALRDILDPRRTPLSSVIGRIAGKLRYGHVVLQTSLGYATTAELLKLFLQDFWRPLVEGAQATASPSIGDHKLLLLLVDDCERQEGWPPFPVARELATWQAALPINLPRLERISKSVISAWLASEAAEIISLMPFEVVADRIYALGGEGIPEYVFDASAGLYSF